MGGFWLYRWGDHAMRTLAVGMWMDEAKIYHMDVPYGHQAYCKCPEDMECAREGDVGGTPANWWVCVPGAAPAAEAEEAPPGEDAEEDGEPEDSAEEADAADSAEADAAEEEADAAEESSEEADDEL